MLRIENVEVELPNFHLGPISIEIKEGDYLVILGPTGSGKTVLLETVMGFYTPKKGKIILDGKDITNLPPNRRGISMVYQDFVLFPHMSVRQNIEYGLIMRRIGKKEREIRVKEVAEIFEIENILDRYPRSLSGGEKQRVALARALAIQPRILLLDEPLSSLHQEMRKSFQKMFKKLNDMGVTIVHVTHNREEAAYLAKRVAVIFSGKILQVGKKEEVFGKPANIQIARFVGMENIMEGTAKYSGNLTKIKVGNTEIYSATKVSGDVVFGIRPEDIVLSLSPIQTSARNVLKCKVVDMEDFGEVLRVYLKCGDISLNSVITKQSAEMLSLKKNIDIYAIFKASSVHIFL